MNPTKTIYALAVLIGTTTWAQESNLSVSDRSWKGIEIRFVTKMEPPGTDLSGGVTIEPGRVHHVINDAAHKRFFGYDLTVDVGADAKTAQIRIEQLQLTSRVNELVGGIGWKQLDLPKYPVIPNVNVGDTVALDLLVNETTGQKVVDYLTVRRRGEMELQHPARDFRLEDVEMALDQPHISVNGKLEASRQASGITGSVVWIYLAGRGRFILSLVPNEKLGFKKSGLASGYGLVFHDGANEYRVECKSRIAPAPGTYNLYVVHQSDWRPEGADAFGIGSGDKPEVVISKK